MRLYFEIKNKDNDKCVPLPLLDKIFAKFFDGQCDNEKYFVLKGECVNWVDVCEGLFWASDLRVLNTNDHEKIEFRALLVCLFPCRFSILHPGNRQTFPYV